MRTWAFEIDSADLAPAPSGFVRAGDEAEAFDLLGTLHADLFPIPEPFEWPGGAAERVAYEQR